MIKRLKKLILDYVYNRYLAEAIATHIDIKAGDFVDFVQGKQYLGDVTEDIVEGYKVVKVIPSKKGLWLNIPASGWVHSTLVLKVYRLEEKK